MNKLIQFINESRQELTKVVWPTRSESLEMTVAVLIIVVVVGLYLGGVDFLLTEILTFLLKK